MNGVKQAQPKPTRKEKAQSTRRRIVEAALAAFTESGYATTTVESVAADAGVAVQTVYFTFRTKGDLLQAVFEHVVFGPERIPPHLSAWWRAVETAPDVVPALRALVEGTLEVVARAAPLVWAVLGDDTAREGYEHNERLRRDGNETIVQILTEKHALLPGLAPDRARDVLLVLTGPALYSHLTRDMGWSHTDVKEWAVATLGQQLFGIETARQSPKDQRPKGRSARPTR